MMGTQLPETCTEVEINILRSSVYILGFIWNSSVCRVSCSSSGTLHCVFRPIVLSCQLQALRRWRNYDPSNRRELFTPRHGVTAQKNLIFSHIALRSSNAAHHVSTCSFQADI